MNFVEASLKTRAINFFVDYIIIFVIIFFAAELKLFPKMLTNDTRTFRLTCYFLIFAYYFIFELFFSITIGKWATKTKVVTTNNSRPDFFDILKRSLLRLIPFDGITFLVTENNGWHDKYSKTKVVHK